MCIKYNSCHFASTIYYSSSFDFERLGMVCASASVIDAFDSVTIPNLKWMIHASTTSLYSSHFAPCVMCTPLSRAWFVLPSVKKKALELCSEAEHSYLYRFHLYWIVSEPSLLHIFWNYASIRINLFSPNYKLTARGIRAEVRWCSETGAIGAVASAFPGPGWQSW